MTTSPVALTGGALCVDRAGTRLHLASLLSSAMARSRVRSAAGSTASLPTRPVASKREEVADTLPPEAHARASAAGPPFAGWDRYELVGKGGMGAVYRERDRRLGRTIAIKLRPSDPVATNDLRVADRWLGADVAAAEGSTNTATEQPARAGIDPLLRTSDVRLRTL